MLMRSRRLLATVSIAALLGAAVVDGATKTFDFTTGSMPVDVTFTRTTQGTYFNSSGVLTLAAIDAPRLDYNPSTFAAKGLLIEPAATNLITRSEEIDNAAWTKNGITVTANAITGPDGTLSFDAVIPNNATVLPYINSAAFTTVSGSTYTLSAYVKNGTLGNNWIQLTAGGAVIYRTWFNLSTGAKGTNSGGLVSYNITSLGGGTYRIDATFTVGSTTTDIYLIGCTADGSSATDVVGNGTSPAFYAYGIQCELGSGPSSYIPTTSAAVTRAADVANVTGTNFSSWYNQTEGTFVWEGDLAKLGTDVTFFAVNDGSSSNRMLIYAAGPGGSSNIDFVATESGGTIVNVSSGAVAVNTMFKAAFGYKLNDFAISLNGATVATDTSGVAPSVNQLELGPTGHVKKITYYNTRKTNTDLQALAA
jgi:hypothetical protein